MFRIVAFALFGLIGFSQVNAQIDDTSRCDKIESYQDAYYRAKTGKKPLVVFITSENCGPCRAFERDTLEPAIKANELDGCVFIRLATEENAEITSKMMNQTKQRGTPQLLVYFQAKSGEGKLLSLFGNQPISKLRQLLSNVKK